MLRQIHVFYKGKIIFSHNLALGLNTEELKYLIPVIKSNIDAPIPGKTFQRPVGEFQIYYRSAGDLFFLFVGDNVDDLSYIDNIIKKTMNSFKEFFLSPEDIDTSNNKIKFLEFLYQQQQELHSKIALIGPIKSGKTTLFNMLKSETEKEIMNFAKTSTFEIEDLTFDIWDFIILDNYSNLWNKFVSSADLIILIFDASNYDLKLVHHFVSIRKSDAHTARLLIIANKNDKISSDEDIKLMKNEIGLPDIHELSLISPESRGTIIDLIIETLRLKKPLPPDYGDLIDKAIKYEEMGNLTEAIIKYRDIIAIAKKHQDSNTLSSFQEKLDMLEKRREEQRISEKEALRKQKFAAPKTVKFSKKPSVKALPAIKPLPSGGPAHQIQPVIPPKREDLKSENIKKTKKIEKKEVKASLIDTFIENGEYHEALLVLIKEQGSSLSLKLAKEFTIKLQAVVNESLSLLDLQIAAELFFEAEKKVNK